MRAIGTVDLERLPQIYEQIDTFARCLQAKLGAVRVILHGSFGTGQVHEGSDVDLIVVAPFNEHPLDRIGIVLRLWPRGLPPLEPMCYTLQEFEQMVGAHNSFVARAIELGKDLLDKPRPHRSPDGQDSGARP